MLAERLSKAWRASGDGSGAVRHDVRAEAVSAQTSGWMDRSACGRGAVGGAPAVGFTADA